MLTVGGNAGDQIDIRPGHLLDELPRIDVHRIQKTPLAFRENKIKRQRAFARAADAGDDHEFLARNLEREILQIMLARAMHRDDIRAGDGEIFVNHRRGIYGGKRRCQLVDFC